MIREPAFANITADERTTSLARRGVVPVQNRRTPSSVAIRYAQWKEFRYCVRASSACIRVLITLSAASASALPVMSGRLLEWHGRVDGHKARDGADAKGDARGEVLPRARLTLDELLQSGICRKADGGVCALAHNLPICEHRPWAENGKGGRTTGKRPR